MDIQGNQRGTKNLNPTLGGSCNYATYPSNSHDFGAMGFVVCYSEYGTVDAIVPFRGYKTYIQDIAPSEDDNFIAVSGYFSRFIEDGPYIWDSLESENVLRGGPTGAPAGITNANYYNQHSSEYPWISGGSSTIGSGDWIYGSYDPPITGNLGIGFDVDVSLENATWFSFNYNDAAPDNQTALLRSLVTGNVIKIYHGITSTSYLIESIESIYGDIGLKYYVKYSAGAKGTFPQSIGDTCSFEFLDYAAGVFPSVKLLRSRSSYWTTNAILCNSPFVAKIGRDLGNTTSFTGLGVNSDYLSDIRKSYRGLGFRHFPAKYMSKSIDVKDTKVDITKYSINLALKSGVNIAANRSVIKTADVSTLKNLWKRTSDGYYTDEKILGISYPISLLTWSQDSVISYVRLLSDDLSLAATVNSTTSQIGSITSSFKYLGSTKSMHNDSSTIITGTSNRSFTMGGINFSGIEGTYKQFYLIVDGSGLGITGGFLDAKTGSAYLPRVTNNQSMYYITSEFGASGGYFGTNFIADASTGTYFLTSGITEQGVSKSFIKTFIDLPSPSTVIQGVSLAGPEQYCITYKRIGMDASPYWYVLKTNLDGTILSTVNFGDANINTFTSTTDDDGNIFMSGYYYNYDNPVDGNSYIYLPNDSGFSLVSKRYKPELGINLGQIISRSGSGAWTWCDVHSTDSGMQIPLMSTVIFNNYASNIYGKKNNKWILTNSITGEELLNVKNTPYFIYTFTAPGNYTIYNSVEDGAGNVYIQAKPGYIEVVNHKQKNPDDKRPDFVNSFDYGQPEVFPGRDYQVHKLAKDLAEEQASILRGEIVPFGSGFTVYHNPDATFRQDG